MSNGQRSRWSSALPSAFGNSASVCRWRRVRGIVYRVQWFGSYRSGRLSDMPDRPSIRKDIHVPVLDARRQRCHLRRIVARPPAHVSARPTAPVCHVWRHRAGAVLTGLSVSATLLFAGLGTLLFHFLSRGKVPAFLGSSFAFIAGYAAIAPNGETELLPYACLGVACAGLLYPVLAAFFRALAPSVSCVSFRRW